MLLTFKTRSMKILFCMILCGFPLLATGQCLLEKLYALTGTLRQEMWAQKGVTGVLPDTLPAWPDFMLDSLDWGGSYDWKDWHYKHGVAKTYCPFYQVYAFIGDGAGQDKARLDVQELLCRWNEHRTELQYYERGYFSGLDKQQLLDSMQEREYRHPLFVAWLEPDFMMELSFLYYGDSVRYMNPEDWRWDKYAQVGDSLKIYQGDSVVMVWTRAEWESQSDIPFGGDTMELLCPEPPEGRKGRRWRRRCYTEPTVLEMKSGLLYVKDSVMYSGFELKGDSLRLVPWQEELDKVYPSFAKHFNGLENWRSIRPSQRTRIVRWIPFSLGYSGSIPQDMLEQMRYNGLMRCYYFPFSDDPDTKDWFPLE